MFEDLNIQHGQLGCLIVGIGEGSMIFDDILTLEMANNNNGHA